MIDTIEQLSEASARNVAVEGGGGMGKTTALCQFARKHPQRAVCVFISASNKLSFDADLILQDIYVQVGWIVRREVLRSDSARITTLKSFYGALQREARRERVSFYFIVDGSEELDESNRAILFQQLSNILPIGVLQFRFLLSGSSGVYRDLFSRGQPIQAYPLNLLSMQETKALLPTGTPDDQLAALQRNSR